MYDVIKTAVTSRIRQNRLAMMYRGNPLDMLTMISIVFGSAYFGKSPNSCLLLVGKQARCVKHLRGKAAFLRLGLLRIT